MNKLTGRFGACGDMELIRTLSVKCTQDNAVSLAEFTAAELKQGKKGKK